MLFVFFKEYLYSESYRNNFAHNFKNVIFYMIMKNILTVFYNFKKKKKYIYFFKRVPPPSDFFFAKL